MEQVRYLRVSLMTRAPHLVGAAPRVGQDGEMPRVMSPIEATYVALSLVHQKLYNPRFQETADGWLERRHLEDLQRYERTPEHRASGPRLISEATPHAAEIRQVIVRALMQQPPGISTDSALDDLGVSR
jgi:hypothetical protein